MQTTDNMERLQQVVGTVLNIPASVVDEDTSPDTHTSWDSLSHIDLVVALEGEFGVSFTAEDTMEMLSVRLIRMILEERGVSFG